MDLNDSTSQKRGRYKTYNPELKRIVSQTGNISLAIDQGVPRTTALYWATKSKQIRKEASTAETLLEKEIESLNKKLEKERAKTQFISSLAKYLFYVKAGKRKISKSVKRLFIKKIDYYKKYCPLSELLSLISLSNSRYCKWKSEMRRCLATQKFECGIRKPNQLTGSERKSIVELASSKKYFHFSLTSLWKYAWKNNIVVCSRDTWFKYVNQLNTKRNPKKERKDSYKVGVRAKHPNQIWHLDLTVVELLNGDKVYLQAIIDNYSRYIVEWKISSNKKGIQTARLIKKAKHKINNATSTQLYMDQGGENKNKKVDEILVGQNIHRIFAKIDVRFSNSVIEAFFRSMKNNFLYSKSFHTMEELKRSVRFYVKEHNNKIPHSAFRFQTPSEIFFSTWAKEKEDTLNYLKKMTLKLRKESNRKFRKCSVCLVKKGDN